MESSNFVRAKLVNVTHADCSHTVVENNRYHYFLKFERPVKWQTVYKRVVELSKELDVSLELWMIHPSGVADFEIEVRETEPRPAIDKNQRGLSDF